MTQPTTAEINELLALGAPLSAAGFQPVLRWLGGTKPDGSIQLPYPEYDPAVIAFMDGLRKDCWLDKAYEPAKAAALLAASDGAASASLQQLRGLLTYILRGERFADGHWDEMIKRGHVARVLARLAELRDA